MNTPDINSPAERPSTPPQFPPEIRRVAEQHVAQRLRHVTIDTATTTAVRKIAFRRVAERLVHESRNRGQIKSR